MKDYSNYHDADVKGKIERDGLFLLEQSLEGYGGHEVIINNSIVTNVLMYQKYDSNGEAKKVIGKIEDIERGNLIKYGDEYWLVVTKPEDNNIYHKAEIRLCSSEFPIGYTDERSVFKGNDHLGNPVYEVIKGDTIYTPCVVEMNSASVAIADNNNAINLLDNKIIITIPFMKSDEIKINEQFIMYDLNYRIIRVDETKSIKGVGIVIITGELTGIGGTSL